VVANRTLTRAKDLAAQFSNLGQIEAMNFDDLKDRQFDLIINSTAASLEGDVLPIPGSVFADGALAYDMMYGKGLTSFLQVAAQAGARTVDGLGMLVEQAAESFFIWRGVRPDTATVLNKLRGA